MPDGRRIDRENRSVSVDDRLPDLPRFARRSDRDREDRRDARRGSGEAVPDHPSLPGSGDRADDDCLPLRTDGSGGAIDDPSDVGSDEDPRIEFVDCETVRVVGDAADVILGTVFWDDHGALGNTQEPVGGVDGERLFHAPSIYGRAAAGPIVTYAETFDDGTTVVPGNGDRTAHNPDYKSCEETARESLEASPDADDAGQ